MYDPSAAPTQEIPVVPRGTSARRPSPGPSGSPYPVMDPDRTQEVPLVALRPAPPGPRGFFGRLWERVRTAPAWVAPAAIATCVAGVSAAVLVTDPTDNFGTTTCAFKLVTGFDCPGCGGTRALYYLLTLRLPEAAQNHAIAVFAAPFLVYLFAQWTMGRVFPAKPWKLPRLRVTPMMATNFLMAWGAFWVLRNLPFAPFTALFV